MNEVVRVSQCKVRSKCLCGGARNKYLVTHSTAGSHDGVTYAFTVARRVWIIRCVKCYNVTYGRETSRLVTAALRNFLSLLLPEQIRSIRQSCDVSVAEMAGSIGEHEATYARIEEGGQLQSFETDKRLCDIRDAIEADYARKL